MLNLSREYWILVLSSAGETAALFLFALRTLSLAVVAAFG